MLTKARIPMAGRPSWIGRPVARANPAVRVADLGEQLLHVVLVGHVRRARQQIEPEGPPLAGDELHQRGHLVRAHLAGDELLHLLRALAQALGEALHRLLAERLHHLRRRVDVQHARDRVDQALGDASSGVVDGVGAVLDALDQAVDDRRPDPLDLLVDRGDALLGLAHHPRAEVEQLVGEELHAVDDPADRLLARGDHEVLRHDEAVADLPDQPLAQIDRTGRDRLDALPSLAQDPLEPVEEQVRNSPHALREAPDDVLADADEQLRRRPDLKEIQDPVDRVLDRVDDGLAEVQQLVARELRRRPDRPEYSEQDAERRADALDPDLRREEAAARHAEERDEDAQDAADACRDLVQPLEDDDHDVGEEAEAVHDRFEDRGDELEELQPDGAELDQDLQHALGKRQRVLEELADPLLALSRADPVSELGRAVCQPLDEVVALGARGLDEVHERPRHVLDQVEPVGQGVGDQLEAGGALAEALGRVGQVAHQARHAPQHAAQERQRAGREVQQELNAVAHDRPTQLVGHVASRVADLDALEHVADRQQLVGQRLDVLRPRPCPCGRRGSPAAG